MFSFLVNTVHAQGLKEATSILGESGRTAGTSNAASAPEIIGNVIATGLSFAGAIFLVLSVYAGYMWMAARGEEDKIKKAQQILQGSIVGLFIAISSYAITTTVAGRIGSVATPPADLEAAAASCCVWDEAAWTGNLIPDLTQAVCEDIGSDEGYVATWEVSTCTEPYTLP